jgi:hypothetical protein
MNMKKNEKMTRRDFIMANASVLALAGAGSLPGGSILAADAKASATKISVKPNSTKCQIGAYYAPVWHPDPWSESIHGKGWIEWEVLKRGEPKYPGHHQPKVPLWGYEDESDPAVMAKKIDAAANHGLSHFIFDWYWYEDMGQFQNAALNRGYLEAKNNDRLQFCLMWANHDRMDFHPIKRTQGAKVYCPGKVTRKTFDTLMDYIVEHYFRHPQYWKIDGCPYFSVYQLMTMVEGLGGVKPAAEAIDSFRRKTRAAGFPDLHLSAVECGIGLLPGEDSLRTTRDTFQKLGGLNSLTPYVWMHFLPLRTFPTVPYAEVAKEAALSFRTYDQNFGVQYIPNITMGWDVSPRACQSDVYDNSGYPFMPMIEGNTPAAFKDVLKTMKSILDKQSEDRRIFTINAWNEWNEGSYLEPDTVNKMGYLEAIRDVFGA